MTEQTLVVEAAPTKEFFVYMLVRDIALPRAILDLVDNCVDGAIRLRAEDSFQGLHVALDVTRERFRIADNCGGIPVDVAQKYAFRFGRLPEAVPTKHSIGQFGVGMKRALFKIGRQFTVQSTTGSGGFVISEDVEEWKHKPDWNFTLTELQLDPAAEPGTTVTIEALHHTVSEAFGLETFITDLRQQVQQAHTSAIERGMTFSVNGIPLEYQPIELLDSETLKPAFRERYLTSPEGVEPVRVRIYAGVGESDPQEAGWYIFCNGRMVVSSDQTETTGWGTEGGTVVPKFHNRSARFRGYVFFDSDNAALLPWNTTKTGVDVDSPVFRSTKQEMISLMRPVIDFLNKLSREVEAHDDETPLQDALEESRAVPLRVLTQSPVFASPQPAALHRVRERKDPVISYRRPMDLVRRVQKQLGVYTQKEVGERTFDYYFALECAD